MRKLYFSTSSEAGMAVGLDTVNEMGPGVPGKH